MEYRNPLPAVDIIIETSRGIVLIRRKNPPLGSALPGGFIQEGESAETAAVREAKEETGLDVSLTDLLGVYSRPDRDPRRHVLSVVYVATAEGTPMGGDDAERAFLRDPASLPDDLAFDHDTILRDYLRFKRTGRRPDPEQPEPGREEV